MEVFAINVLVLIASGTRRRNPDLSPIDAPEHFRERRLPVQLGLALVGFGLSREANALASQGQQCLCHTGNRATRSSLMDSY